LSRKVNDNFYASYEYYITSRAATPALGWLMPWPKVTAQAVTWPIEPFWRLSPSWPVALGRSRPTLGGVGVPGAGERQVLFVLAQTDTRVFPG